MRSEVNRGVVWTIAALVLRSKGPFLDFGGGDGLFARMMRDVGIEFWSEDKYLPNTRCDLRLVGPVPSAFEAVTLFEVFEHLSDPFSTFETVFERSPTLLFTTEPIPRGGVNPDWWYFSWATGQHILFASRKGIGLLAGRLDANVVSVGQFHFLSRRSLPRWRVRTALLFGRFAALMMPVVERLSSLAVADMDAIQAGYWARAERNSLG
jgi:hypothetical protein